MSLALLRHLPVGISCFNLEVFLLSADRFLEEGLRPRAPSTEARANDVEDYPP